MPNTANVGTKYRFQKMNLRQCFRKPRQLRCARNVALQLGGRRRTSHLFRKRWYARRRTDRRSSDQRGFQQQSAQRLRDPSLQPERHQHRKYRLEQTCSACHQ